METIRDSGLSYPNGDRILEGDLVEFEYSRQGGGAMPDKIEGIITYKNAAFYIVFPKEVWKIENFEITLDEILKNNAQVPDKFPMSIRKINKNKI